MIDDAVAQFRAGDFDVVIGIGGGSVLDAAKAIAGLLRIGNTVMDYLEGVCPEKPYRGPATPFIAVPTTAGTGSEATKNAVLSQPGKDGYKKSFRDDLLVPEYAIVDPDLLISCPPELIAANGMDALTQLIESYVSLRANTFTDALAINGLRAARDGLLPWYEGTGDETSARSRMAYAALISGITLAQVGLGSVHGLAAPMGAFFTIPHGVVCGTLVGAELIHDVVRWKKLYEHIMMIHGLKPSPENYVKLAMNGSQTSASSYPFEYRYSCSSYVAHVLKNHKEWVEFLNETPPTTLCINFNKSTVDKVMNMLHQESLPAEQSILRTAIITSSISKYSNVIQQHLAHVQDESSQLVSLLTTALGESIFDYCAGNGGKCLAIASITKNGKKLFAYEMNSIKRTTLKRRCIDYNAKVRC